MQYLMFTKHLEGMDIPRVIETLKFVGVEGADLCVRPGHPVNPENAPTALPEAAKQFADAGMSIPLITTPAEYLSTEVEYAESLMAACAEAGTPLIKLGYWRYTGETDYWTLLDQCRAQLDGMAKLAEKHGVKVCVHNHSGSSMGLNSCAAMNVVKGFDPKHVGIFFDPAHLSLVGEPLPMAMSIVKDYFALTSFKDAVRERTGSGAQRGWTTRVVPLGEGFVDFPTFIRLLTEREFTGPVSFHSEYSGYPVDTVIDIARCDVRYLNGLRDALKEG